MTATKRNWSDVVNEMDRIGFALKGPAEETVHKNAWGDRTITTAAMERGGEQFGLEARGSPGTGIYALSVFRRLPEGADYAVLPRSHPSYPNTAFYPVDITLQHPDGTVWGTPVRDWGAREVHGHEVWIERSSDRSHVTLKFHRGYAPPENAFPGPNPGHGGARTFYDYYMLQAQRYQEGKPMGYGKFPILPAASGSRHPEFAVSYTRINELSQLRTDELFRDMPLPIGFSAIYQHGHSNAQRIEIETRGDTLHLSTYMKLGVPAAARMFEQHTCLLEEFHRNFRPYAAA